MAAIVTRENTWLAGAASRPARAGGMIRRAMAWVAAAVLTGATAAALLQVVAQILSFPAPIAAIAITLIAAALLTSLRRHLRAQHRHRYGPGNRIAPGDKPARI